MKNLKHLIQIKDFNTEIEQPYIVLNYCADQDLAKFYFKIRNKLFQDPNDIEKPEKLALYFLKQIKDGMINLWGRCENVMMHRDLKMQNILIHEG